MTTRRLAVLLLTAVVIAACAPPLYEDPPAAGSVFVTADPVPGRKPLELVVLDGQGDSVGRFSFAQGERIIAQFLSLPGAYRVAVDGQCELAVRLESGVETDVVLHQLPGGCVLEAGGTHPVGGAGHVLAPATVTLANGNAPELTRIVVESLDDPPNPVPSPLPRDEGGGAYFPELVPGEYRFLAVAGDVLLGHRDAVIAPEPSRNEIVIELDQ